MVAVAPSMRTLVAVGLVALAACEWGVTGNGIDGGSHPCSGVTCSANELCDFSNNACGAAPGETGTCRPRSQTCADVSGPVCGCDGKMHDNACDAYADGTDLDAYGNCPLDEDQFRCGFKQCSTTDEVCQRDGAVLHGDLNTNFSCVPMPAACKGSPSCQCLLANQGGLCISRCDRPSGFVVTCDAGLEAL